MLAQGQPVKSEPSIALVREQRALIANFGLPLVCVSTVNRVGHPGKSRATAEYALDVLLRSIIEGQEAVLIRHDLQLQEDMKVPNSPQHNSRDTMVIHSSFSTGAERPERRALGGSHFSGTGDCVGISSRVQAVAHSPAASALTRCLNPDQP